MNADQMYCRWCGNTEKHHPCNKKICKKCVGEMNKDAATYTFWFRVANWEIKH